MQILKSDSLAMMCALSPTVKTALGGMEDVDELKKQAKDIIVYSVKGTDEVVRGLELSSIRSR
jgi:hypothetical protein